MNIFAIDPDASISAKHLVDKHCVKMILESVMMLTNCFSPEILALPDCPKTKKGETRKHSYFNHPCSIWTRQSRANMLWLIEHALCLDEERRARYNNQTQHFSISFAKWALKNIHLSSVKIGPQTPFALAMPDEYREKCPIKSYQNYYKFGKKHLHQWKRNKPDWI